MVQVQQSEILKKCTDCENFNERGEKTLIFKGCAVLLKKVDKKIK